MANLNKVFIIGRITKEIELKHTTSGKAVASFSVAVNRKGKDAGADFINCVAWEKTAEFIDKYFGKGSAIFLEGELRTRNYEDSNGNKKTATEVNVNNVDFVESKSSEAKAEKRDFEELSTDDQLPF